MVDSYSGFFDFVNLKYSTSKEVIQHFKNWFAVHGIPEKLETDNGPQFSSLTFKAFAKEWGFQHRISSPEYPQSNGLTERHVQIAKLFLNRCRRDNTDIIARLFSTLGTLVEMRI